MGSTQAKMENLTTGGDAADFLYDDSVPLGDWSANVGKPLTPEALTEAIGQYTARCVEIREQRLAFLAENPELVRFYTGYF